MKHVTTSPDDYSDPGEVRFLTLSTEQDYLAWDRFLRDSRHGHIRHAQWWLESLRRCGVSSFILAGFANGQPVGGAGILHFQLPPFPWSVLLILHGPVFTDPTRHCPMFVRALAHEAARRHAMLVQFSAVPDPDTQQCLNACYAKQRTTPDNLWTSYASPTPYCVVSLADQPLDSLWRAFSHGTRSRIKKAPKHGIEVAHATTIDEFREAHATWQSSAVRKGFLVRPFESAGYAMEEARRRDMGCVLVARIDGRIAASAFIAWAGEEAHYVSGGFRSEFRKQCPTHVIQWEVMKLLSERGIRYYNMGNYSEDGVGEFKLGFGARIQHIDSYLAWVRHPFLWNASNALLNRRLRKWLRRWTRRQHGFASKTQGD